MDARPPFEEYVASLGRLTAHVDPTYGSAEAVEIDGSMRSGCPYGRGRGNRCRREGFRLDWVELTDAVREIEEMADVRLPRQYIIAVIDGIGWKSRQADLLRICTLWESQQINGMFTLSSLDRFRNELADAARLRGLLD